MSESAFLLQVLRAAADDPELDPEHLGFAVIVAGTTKVSGSGRMAGQVVDLAEVTFRPFEQGEIVVLQEDQFGREPFGDCRKPSKWDVVTEWFGHDWEAAKRRSDEVKKGRPVDGFAAPSR